MWKRHRLLRRPPFLAIWALMARMQSICLLRQHALVANAWWNKEEKNFILFLKIKIYKFLNYQKKTTTNYASSNTISRSYYSCAPTTCPTNTNLVGYTCCSTANCNTGDAPLSSSQSSHFISHFGVQFMVTLIAVVVTCAN